MLDFECEIILYRVNSTALVLTFLYVLEVCSHNSYLVGMCQRPAFR